jgi:3-methyladenine DNA glycosylase/8-oxoguanine DNA glycosylase
MRAAVAHCHGLRLLRQDPWECLASFILSSTKQIVQIRQIVALLCENFGEPLSLSASNRPSATLAPSDAETNGVRIRPIGISRLETLNRRNVAQPSPAAGSGGVSPPVTISGRDAQATRRRDADATGFMGRVKQLCSFPTPDQIAALTEAQLRACKMGFRAPNLLLAAREIADGKLNLEHLRALDYAAARAALMTLRGVGGKIADCVLLFAYGFDTAFPVDVWIERALQELYFPRRRASEKRLRHFAAHHFGPHAGYAQQYLFHYMRTKS